MDGDIYEDMNADEEDEDMYVILNSEEKVAAAVSTWTSSTSKQQGQFKSSLVQKVVRILSVAHTMCCTYMCVGMQFRAQKICIL